MMRQKNERKLLCIMVLLSILAAVVLFLLGAGRYETFIERTYTVQPGDTLDGLYYEYGSGDLLKWRYEVKKLNSMEESGLYTGDEIIILVSKDETEWK